MSFKIEGSEASFEIEVDGAKAIVEFVDHEWQLTLSNRPTEAYFLASRRDRVSRVIAMAYEELWRMGLTEAGRAWLEAKK